MATFAGLGHSLTVATEGLAPAAMPLYESITTGRGVTPDGASLTFGIAQTLGGAVLVLSVSIDGDTYRETLATSDLARVWVGSVCADVADLKALGGHVEGRDRD